jgi:hypothetical protein
MKKSVVLISIILITIVLLGATYYLYIQSQNNKPPQPSLREKFMKFASDHGFSNVTASYFYGNYTDFVTSLYPERSYLLIPDLGVYSQNDTLFADFHRNISQDPRVTMDRNVLLSETCDLTLQLNLANKNLNGVTERAIGNLSLAYNQLGLPRHSNTTTWLLTNYTLALDLSQSPYVLNKSDSFRFFSALLRQHNLVLDIVKLDPTDPTVRLTYVKPDIDYYYQTLPSKNIVINGTTINFPLLPLLNGTAMREQFPNMTDEMVIYATQYPVQFAFFNAVTGEYKGNPAQGWTPQYGQKALLDDLNLVWNGGTWGKFEGKLIDRIIKAYTDKEWRSYEHSPDWSDYTWARRNWYDWELNMSYIYKDFEKTDKEFKANYDPKLANDPIMDLGLRFSDGLAVWDSMKHEPQPIPHQYSRTTYILYAKALGYGGIEVWAKDPSYPYSHETAAGAIPKYLLDQLPSDGRYAPGKMISQYVYGYDSSGNPLKLTASLPTGETINF